jgi:putative acetyltransferase
VRDLTIGLDDPLAPDVLELLERHLTTMYAATPICEVYALDPHALTCPEIALFSARRRGRVVAIGALKEIDAEHGELKSMHTAEASRGQGAGRAMLEHLLTVGRSRGYARISLETGTTDVFTPARSLYASVGFTTCPPFGEYVASPNSVCMTLRLR